MQVFIEKVSVSESEYDEVASGWHFAIEIVEQLKDINLEVSWLAHAIEALLAYIVSDEFQKHQQWKIIFSSV